ncbi:hypothetical protein [Pseudomonas putida]|uniref:hypothetical protein n=1 Tax=Pseudomonas putida TaxID=303 RepID=UPI00130EEE88|nr:hypothetical protein [Pseudomonas putida]
MLDWLFSNKEWVFSGVGVALILRFSSIFRSKKAKQGNGSISQVANGNGLSIQGASAVTVGDVTILQNKIPPALVMPKFFITQVGFSGSYGKLPEYTFQINNHGGPLFTVSVKANISNVEHFFPKFSRGQSKSVKFSFSGENDSLEVIINGYDENGAEYKRTFLGTRYTDGFKFS